MKSTHLAALLAATVLSTTVQAQTLETAIFAGGCFWCVESDFDKVEGVMSTTSGYTGGDLEEPTYEQVSKTETGHYEAVQITYDADEVSYEELLHVFWRSVDPTDAGGQFCDRGNSYRTAVFAANTDQARIAKSSRKEAANDLGQDIVTPILAASTFWPAEEYHQDYYQKNPVRYRYYRFSCGRDGRVKELWGDAAYSGVHS
ncbi:peptide-methionine (S)-S-oxide reductase MsrA [Amaricoccus tamworthensis]|uniref:peptide-methionine (S)-S-oxide reductase MsrA n=1 Tax=Amaricoccus tamworthensis TaxID=57002 RepID=UPI003C7D0D2C